MVCARVNTSEGESRSVQFSIIHKHVMRDRVVTNYIRKMLNIQSPGEPHKSEVKERILLHFQLLLVSFFERELSQHCVLGDKLTGKCAKDCFDPDDKEAEQEQFSCIVSQCYFIYYIYLFCFGQAHHCGAFIQKTFIHHYNIPLAHSFTSVIMNIIFFIYKYFCFSFGQARHCGAFILKHSSIITIFLSLTHLRVLCDFFLTCTSCTTTLTLGHRVHNFRF